MNESVKLTTNQKRVIIGLCTYPNKSDSEIAQHFSVKRSTFSTVKRQLIEQSIIQPHNIPNVLQLGAKVLAIGFAHFNPIQLDRFRQSRRQDLLSRLIYFPNLVSTAFESYNGISFLISKSFTDVILAHNAITGFYLANNLSAPRDLSLFISSITDENIYHFMEYGRLLACFWNISVPKKVELIPIFPSTTTKTKQISPLGWKIYKSVIENPGTTIIELSKLNNKPRNTIARWLRFFQQNHLYLTRYIPDLQKLGLQIQTYYNLSIQGFNLNNKHKYLELIKEKLYPTNLFSSQREIVLFTASKDYFNHREAETKLFNALEMESIPFFLNKRINFSTKRIMYPKEFQKSLIPLIEYLQTPGKYSLKPFKEGNINVAKIN